MSKENRRHREPNFISSSILEVLAPFRPTCNSTSDTVVLSCTMRRLLLKIQFYVLMMILFCLLQCGMLYLMCIAHIFMWLFMILFQKFFADVLLHCLRNVWWCNLYVLYYWWLYCIVVWPSVLCCIVLCCIVLYCIVLYCDSMWGGIGGSYWWCSRT